MAQSRRGQSRYGDRMTSQRAAGRIWVDGLALLGMVWLLPFSIIALGAPVVLVVRLILEVTARF